MNLVSRMNWHPIYNQDFYHRSDQFPGQNFWFSQSSLGSGPSLVEDVKVELQNRKLWSKFHGENTEMIITKSGRRMFPSMQVCVSGLQKRARYVVILEVAPATNRRHKYVMDGNLENGIGKTSPRGWTTAGPAEPQPSQNRRIYLHPDGPATGAHWMQHPISFGKLKITNNAVDPHNHVVLTSMHKYIPKIWIIRCDEHREDNIISQPCKAFCFPETEFIAVTAYQNENITKLKINNNPFAKGFRETGQSRCKRKQLQTSEDQSLDLSSSDCETGQLCDDSFKCPAKRLRRTPSETGSVTDDCSVSCSSGGATPPPEHHAGNQTRLYRPWDDSHSPCRSQESTLPTLTRVSYHSLFYPLLASQQQFAALEYSRLHFQSHLVLNNFF